MTNGAGWVPEIQQRIRIIIDEAERTRDWATSVGLPHTQVERMLKPYSDMLESLHTDDLQLARLLDEAEFVVGVEGTFFKYGSTPISTMVSLLQNTKKQVLGRLRAKSGSSSKRIPKSFELNLVGFAKGSLYVGFGAPDSNQEGLFGESDPLTIAVKDALQTLSITSELVSQHKNIDEIAEFIPDPAIRDAAIQAVQHLAPNSRSGSTRVFITGKSIHGKRVELTKDDKSYALEIVKKPRKVSREVVYLGKIREIDLDQRRFELREVDGLDTDVRCVYEQEFDAMARDWLDRNVDVRGQCEFDYEGRPRLLFVESVRVIAQSKAQELFN